MGLYVITNFSVMPLFLLQPKSAPGGEVCALWLRYTKFALRGMLYEGFGCSKKKGMTEKLVTTLPGIDVPIDSSALRKVEINLFWLDFGGISSDSTLI